MRDTDMSPTAWLAAVVIAAVTLGGTHWKAYTMGERSMKAEWDADSLKRANAEKAAVLARVSENQQIFRQQEITNQNITKAHNDELAKVRTDLARSERMRIGSSFCPRPATTTQATGAGGSDGTDTTTRVLSESMDRSVKSLILEMEQVAATGRACQSFVRKNGMAP